MLCNQTQHGQTLSTPLTVIGDSLWRFIEHSDFSVWVKDIKTRKHVMNNKACALKWGLQSSGLTQMTSRDVLSQVSGFYHLNEEVARIEHNETVAIHNQAQNQFSQTLLNYNGFVCIQQTILTPVYGFNNKDIAVVGIAMDGTAHTDLLYLLTRYKRYYADKKLLIKKLSQSLRLAHYFQQELTYMQLVILLAMEKDQRHKKIADIISTFHSQPIVSRTASNYIAALKAKLKTNIKLYDVINHLRVRGQWKQKPITS